jgi:type I restriction enzyme, R subunit
LSRTLADDRQNFKSLLRDFVKLYGFLSKIIPFKDKKLEKFYAFTGFLVKKPPSEGPGSPHEVLDMSDLDNYKPALIGEEAIGLERGQSNIDPKNYGAGTSSLKSEEIPLSHIIEKPQRAIRNQIYERRPGGHQTDGVQAQQRPYP